MLDKLLQYTEKLFAFGWKPALVVLVVLVLLAAFVGWLFGIDVSAFLQP